MSGIVMQYKGYLGNVTLDEDAGVFHGEVVNTRDVITFQGRSVDELRDALRDSVEDYLEFCRERNEEPEKPYSGQVLLRMTPELHRAAAERAMLAHQSLNQWVADRIADAISQDSVAA
jgi:predicted HicB family RNase H-like nuclease